MAWLSRLWNGLRSNRLSREIDWEMAFHLAERTDDLVASGMAPEAAQREARRRFGNYAAQKERIRDTDLLVWLSIIATIALFWPIHVGAALLLVPYLAWVTFATALNLAVWRLNSPAQG